MNHPIDNLWLGLTVWAVLYISDYALTLTCARLYRRGGAQKITFEGSFEITPYFQNDIDSLRVVSPRFLVAWGISCIYLSAIWWLAALSNPGLYEFILGAMILLELTVHIRHFRNLYLFRAILNGAGVQGQIKYPRPLMLKMSAIELLAFAGLYAALFAVTSSWLLLGGAFTCFSTALKHLALARKAVSTMLPKASLTEITKQSVGSELTVP